MSTAHITIDVNPAPTRLSELADKHGTDKGSVNPLSRFNNAWPVHNYTYFYDYIFESKREEIKNVFECGLGTNNPNVLSNMQGAGVPGGSLRMWREYFPNAHVYGADIDRDILFTEDRITTTYVDQLDSTSVAELAKWLPKDLDVIIDDGLHTADAAISLFLGIANNLRPGGVYIVEDVWHGTEPDLTAWLVDNRIPYELVNITPSKNNHKLVVIRKPNRQ